MLLHAFGVFEKPNCGIGNMGFCEPDVTLSLCVSVPPNTNQWMRESERVRQRHKHENLSEIFRKMATDYEIKTVRTWHLHLNTWTADVPKRQHIQEQSIMQTRINSAHKTNNQISAIVWVKHRILHSINGAMGSFPTSSALHLSSHYHFIRLKQQR